MNLQDYIKWQEWDYRLEHETADHKMPPPPVWFYILVVVGLLGMCAAVIFVRSMDWIRKCDPVELFAALWAVVCMGLFVAGMLVAIWN